VSFAERQVELDRTGEKVVIDAETGQVAGLTLTLTLTPLSECYDKLGEEVWA